MTTLNNLNLTRPEKAILVTALCQVETDIAPTIQNVTYFQLNFVKKVLEMHVISSICFILDKETTLSLMEKLGVK